MQYYAYVTVVIDWLWIVALLPGGICHELAHAIACRIFGVRITEIVLFDRLVETGDRTEAVGMIRHDTIERPEVSVSVLIAPLVLNSLVALLSFSGVGWLLFTQPAPIGTDDIWVSVSLVESVFRGIRTAGGLRGLTAMLLFWVGLSMSTQAVPSAGDLRKLSAVLGSASTSPTRLGAVVSFSLGGLQRFRSEVAVIYAIATALLAIAGPAITLGLWKEALLLFVVRTLIEYVSAA